MFESLPNDVLDVLFSTLSFQEVFVVASCSRRLYKAVYRHSICVDITDLGWLTYKSFWDLISRIADNVKAVFIPQCALTVVKRFPVLKNVQVLQTAFADEDRYEACDICELIGALKRRFPRLRKLHCNVKFSGRVIELVKNAYPGLQELTVACDPRDCLFLDDKFVSVTSALTTLRIFNMPCGSCVRPNIPMLSIHSHQLTHLGLVIHAKSPKITGLNFLASLVHLEMRNTDFNYPHVDQAFEEISRLPNLRRLALVKFSSVSSKWARFIEDAEFQLEVFSVVDCSNISDDFAKALNRHQKKIAALVLAIQCDSTCDISKHFLKMIFGLTRLEYVYLDKYHVLNMNVIPPDFWGVLLQDNVQCNKLRYIKMGQLMYEPSIYGHKFGDYRIPHFMNYVQQKFPRCVIDFKVIRPLYGFEQKFVRQLEEYWSLNYRKYL